MEAGGCSSETQMLGDIKSRQKPWVQAEPMLPFLHLVAPVDCANARDQPAACYYIRKHEEQKPRGRTRAQPAAARPPEVHDTRVWVGPSFCCVNSSRQVKD